MFAVLLYLITIFKIVLACPASKRKDSSTSTIISASFSFSTQDEDQLCAQKPYHSWCLKSFGQTCYQFKEFKELPIDDQETIDFIVNQHNKYRSQVAQGSLTGFPSAGNMQKLQWNSILAKLAQNWANQCIFQHESRDNRTLPGWKSVGQNLFQSKVMSSKQDTNTRVIHKKSDF